MSSYRLLWTSRSPFARKAMVAALELGLADRIETVPVHVAASRLDPRVQAHNPLNKIPTLLGPDGLVLYDSRVICEYLDGLSDKAVLFPKERMPRMDALRRETLGNGIMENSVLRVNERSREVQSTPHLTAFAAKTSATLDQLEKEADAFAAKPVDIGHVAVACALAHLNFRFAADAWQTSRPRLAAWHKAFEARESMTKTIHIDPGQ